MTLAQANKEKALEYMDQITASQQEAKLCAQMIAKARELQNGLTGNTCSEMPADMVNFFNSRGISFDHTGNDNLHKKEEWDYNIQSLQNYQETIGTETQQKMVFVQDFMGQYNSYLTGSNSAIQQSNQTLQSIARGQ
jgi:hypothetical protein